MKKFKLDRRCVFFSIVSLLIVSLFAFGSASWTMAITKNYDSDSINKIDLDEGRVVCYINENTEANQYRSVEMALAKANAAGSGTVYVIPTADGTECQPVHIKCNVTIKNGVTLSLPYSGTSIEAGDDDARAVSDNCVDCTTARAKQYRRTQVILNEGKTITVESGGTISIGGINGVKGAHFGGIVSGNYTELSMSKNSKIVNNGGSINCYGYIKEYDKLNNGSLIELNSGTMICPLAIYDYQGGTATLQMLNNSDDNKVCPFSIFDLASVQAKIRVFSSAFLKVKASLFVSGFSYKDLFGKQHTIGEGFYPSLKNNNDDSDRIVTMIGNSTSKTILQLSKGYIDVKYTPSIIGLTGGGDDNTKTVFGVNGTVGVGSFSLDINGKNLDTSKFFFPISWRLEFEIFSGSSVTFGQKLKFLPGSSLMIRNGATLNITNQTVFYPKTAIFTTVANKYRTDKEASRLISNGTMNVTGSFGGTISSNASTGIINYNSSAYSVSSKEPTGKPAESTGDKIGVVVGTKKFDVTSTTYNATYISDSSGSTTKITSSGTYKSQGTYFVKQ